MAKEQINIIPEPVQLTDFSGKFVLNKDTTIIIDKNLKENGEYLKKILNIPTGLDLNIKQLSQVNIEGNVINLKLDSDQKSTGNEGYLLKVMENDVTISALTPVGIFYGIQSLRQLLPEEIESSKLIKNIEWPIPCVEILDYPRFTWRGFMLDIGRHFFDQEVIKKIFDVMALLKMNVFHLHLTEDQGWRIEINKYPKLIDIGSKRKESHIGGREGRETDGIPHQGHLTKENIREIVSYASDLFIKVIPEIEMPGHSMAALASYPELSCTGGPFEVAVIFGIYKDVYCAGKEKVFEFLQNVLDETMEIFPSDIIHIGGDEVPKDRWKECPDCQTRIKKENLKDEDDLQAYFINRITEFLTSRGRKVMGWNEILHHNLKEDVIVQFWTGTVSKILKNLQEGRNFVMTKFSTTYINYGYDVLSLKKCYNYDPIPKRLEEQFHKNILGIEAPIWTEWIQDTDRLFWLTFPRLIAIAEIGWTPKEKKNLESFKNRLVSFHKRLNYIGVGHAKLEEI